MSYLDKIKNLKNLFPTGRAFKIPFGGYFEKLEDAMAESEARAYADAISTLDSALPDNDNFTDDDATAWETRLGLITNEALSIEVRKAAIRRKMNHPGTVKARENWRFIEASLQAAGFDVYVYENRFDDGMGGYVTKTPAQFSYEPFPTDDVEHGELDHGEFDHGGLYGNKIVNSIYANEDFYFDPGANLRSSFFIGGSPAGQWADVDAAREIEFRQLVLRLKPVQTVAFLLVSFV